MTYSVPDMSCGHCTAAIEAAIKAKDPGATVECDLANRRVAVTGALSGTEIESTLAEAGYPATPIMA